MTTNATTTASSTNVRHEGDGRVVTRLTIYELKLLRRYHLDKEEWVINESI